MSKGKKAKKKEKAKGSDSSKSNNGSYESASSQKYNSSKARKEKAKREGGLEQRLKKAAGKVEAIVKKLVKGGMSESEARAVVREMMAAHERKEYSHNWLNDAEYQKRIQAYAKNAKFKDLIKGTWYLFFCLTDVASDRDPYKDVEEGAAIVYLPGWLAIPRDVRPFEKALGKKVAYVNSTDLAEIHKVIRYAAEKHGRVQVVGFSDGGKLIQDYINKYGDGLVDRFYSVASNPFNSSSSRVTHVIGDRDRLAAQEREYTWIDKGYKGVKPEVVYGGHTYFCFDKKTLGELASIVNSSRPTRAYYKVRPSEDSNLVMRLVA
jgi:polyhydroxyalkanoate synthesis regulator phasin